MLTLYLGAVEISQAIGIDRKVTLTSRTVADLASQVSSLASSDMSNILAASSSVIAPYDSTKLKVTVSEVTIDSNSKATVTWSCTRHLAIFKSTPEVRAPGRHCACSRFCGDAAKRPQCREHLPDWGEATYAYTPTIGYVVTGTLNLSDHIYMSPRVSSSVSGSC